MADDVALKAWNEARAAAMASGVYPADVVNSILLSRCVALLEKLVEQTAKPEPSGIPEGSIDFTSARYPGQRIAGIPNAK